MYNDFDAVAWDIIETKEGNLAATGSRFWTFIVDKSNGEVVQKPILEDSPISSCKTISQISDNRVVFDHSEETGITASLESEWNGYSVEFISAYFGNKQPSYTGIIQVDRIAFYDIRIRSSSLISGDATLQVTIENDLFTPQSVLSYWNGKEWVSVSSELNEPNSITAKFQANILNGTPIMIGNNNPALQPGNNNIDYDDSSDSNINDSDYSIPYEIIIPVSTVVIFALIVLAIAVRRRKSANSA